MSFGTRSRAAAASISGHCVPHPRFGAISVSSSCTASTRIAPGETTFNVTPVPARSRASDTARLCRAASVAV